MSEPGRWCTCGAGEFQPPEIHVAPCPGAIDADAIAHAPPADDAASFTAPEKIVSVARAVTARPSRDPKVNVLLGLITSGMGRRFVVDPVLALLPPFEDADEWDQWLAVLVGCALELKSDGVEFDVDACRDVGKRTLDALFEGEL